MVLSSIDYSGLAGWDGPANTPITSFQTWIVQNLGSANSREANIASLIVGPAGDIPSGDNSSISLSVTITQDQFLQK